MNESPNLEDQHSLRSIVRLVLDALARDDITYLRDEVRKSPVVVQVWARPVGPEPDDHEITTERVLDDLPHHTWLTVDNPAELIHHCARLIANDRVESSMAADEDPDNLLVAILAFLYPTSARPCGDSGMWVAGVDYLRQGYLVSRFGEPDAETAAIPLPRDPDDPALPPLHIALAALLFAYGMAPEHLRRMGFPRPVPEFMPSRFRNHFHDRSN